MKLTVHLIGPYPPPYGGVSTHIARIRNRLLNDGHTCTVWSSHHRPVQGFRKLDPQTAVAELAADPSAILHFHGKHLLAGLLAGKGRKVLFTVHNQRINDDLGYHPSPYKWWHTRRTRAAFLRVQRLLAVSEGVACELLRFGFPASAVTVIPAYLPPDQSEQADPGNLAELAIFRRRHGLLLTACAGTLKRHHDVDLYGIDLCVELLGRISASRPGVGLVLALPGSDSSRELSALRRRVARLGLERRVLFLLAAGAYHPILRQCDLYLRPTNTDGFSISIAEAFEFNVPVVASDAVPRPNGCLLFPSRNLDGLITRVDSVLSNLELLRAACPGYRVKDHYLDILRVYQTLMRETSGQLRTGVRMPVVEEYSESAQ